MTKRKMLIYWIESRRTLLLALPMMLGQLSHILLGIVDSMMVGQLGTIPLAAASLGNSVFIIPLVFGFGVSACISTLVARADGAQDFRECGELLRHGLWMNLVMALLLIGILELFIPWIDVLNQPPEVVRESIGFLRIMGWSMLPALLFQAFKNFSDGLHETKWPMFIMMASVVVNVGLNFLLIFGNWGFPALGLLGSGIATFTTRILMLIAIILLVVRSGPLQANLPLRWRGRLSLERLKAMLKIGVPTGFQVLFEVGAFSMAAIMMGWIGAESLAAHQVAISVASATFMIPLSLSFAVSIRVGNSMGANLVHIARRIGLGGFWMAAVCSLAFTIFFVLGRNWLPTLYTTDVFVLEIAGGLFVLAGCFQLFDGLQVVGAGALRGLLDIRYPTIVTFVAYWGLSLPLGYLFAFKWQMGANGIWAGLSLGLLVAAALLGFRFNRLTCKKS